MSATADLAACFPTDSADWLYDALGLQPGDELGDAVLEPLFQLNQAWTPRAAAPAGVARARPGVDPAYARDLAVMRSYALYYMPVNMPKLWFLLDRCAPLLRALLAAHPAPRVAELGCGPGTFLWAWLFWLRRHAPQALAAMATRPVDSPPWLTGIDHAEAALTHARALGDALARWPDLAPHAPAWQPADWRAVPLPDVDLLLIANTLNEAADAPLPIDALTAWGGHTLVIIEPGTTEVFHRLLPLRDALLAAGWHCAFPCPRAAACPMAATFANWCHFHVNRFLLPHVQRMSNRAGRQNPRHHFVGLVFSRDPAALAPPDTWRVLSRLRKANRSGIRHLCDGVHLTEAVLNRKARSDANRYFLDAEPGDLGRLRSRRSPGDFARSARIDAADAFTPLDP